MYNKTKDRYEETEKIKVEDIRLPACSVFESMRSYQGRIFKLEEHLCRLYESAQTSGLKMKLSRGTLKKKIMDKFQKSGLKKAYIRVRVTSPSLEAGLNTSSPDNCSDKTRGLNIIVKPLAEYPRECYEQGVSVVTVSARKNTPSAVEQRIKAGDFLWGVMGKIESFPQGAFEILLLNHQGYVAEGAVSNIFLVKDNQIITPPASSGILEGITAGVVMDLAKKIKIILLRQPLTRHQLYNADEVFLTNTTMEIMPVAVIDGRHMTVPCPGRLTRRLQDAYRKLT